MNRKKIHCWVVKAGMFGLALVGLFCFSGRFTEHHLTWLDLRGVMHLIVDAPTQGQKGNLGGRWN